jgi:dihydroorotate dehydrogenase electron transfer subunit
MITSKEIYPHYGLLRFLAPEIAAVVRPGQFVMVAVPGHTLRRPFAVATREGDSISLLVYRLGSGSATLLDAAIGSQWSLFGPLGRGFAALPQPTLLISRGRGVGSGALLALAQLLRSQNQAVMAWFDPDDDPNRLIAAQFELLGVQMVNHWPQDQQPWHLVIAAEREVARDLYRQATTLGYSSEIYLTERMACGVGACLACMVRLAGGPQPNTQAHVCIDGPVFAGAVVFGE